MPLPKAYLQSSCSRAAAHPACPPCEGSASSRWRERRSLRREPPRRTEAWRASALTYSTPTAF